MIKLNKSNEFFQNILSNKKKSDTKLEIKNDLSSIQK